MTIANTMLAQRHVVKKLFWQVTVTTEEQAAAIHTPDVLYTLQREGRCPPNCPFQWGKLPPPGTWIPGWGLSAGYQPRPQVVDRGTTARYGGQLRYI